MNGIQGRCQTSRIAQDSHPAHTPRTVWPPVSTASALRNRLWRKPLGLSPLPPELSGATQPSPRDQAWPELRHQVPLNSPLVQIPAGSRQQSVNEASQEGGERWPWPISLRHRPGRWGLRQGRSSRTLSRKATPGRCRTSACCLISHSLRAAR